MKFAIISDTHDNIPAIKDMVKELKNEKVEFIVHAGDIIAPFSLKEFLDFSKLYIAFGNNDGERKLLTSIAIKNGWKIGDIVEFPIENSSSPETLREDLEGRYPFGVVYHGTDSEIVKILLKSKYELLVLGHTHEPEIKKVNSVLVVNPGEICGYLTGRKTYAIWEDEEVSIIEL